MYQPSVWEKQAFHGTRDIIIVGSGLAGLWSAYYLRQLDPKLRILIAERGIFPSGASVRNAGFACFGSATELLADARSMGEQQMLEMVAMRVEGLRRMRKLLSKSDTGYERNGGYELVTSAQYPRLKQLKNDIGWLNITLRRALKEEKVFRFADKKIKHFGFAHTAHLVENRMEAQLDSGKLVQALLRKVQQMGVDVITQTEVKGFEKANGKILLQTNLPVELSAHRLLICTNGFSRQLLPNIDISPARGQVLLTTPIKKLPFKGVFHFDEGFYYFRNIGNRVLLGGARNKALEAEQTDELSTTDFIQNELEHFLANTVLPKQSFTIEQRWSGIMGMGGDKTPIVRKIKKDVFCAVRLGGMGLAIAPVVGEMAARQVLSK